MDVGSLADDLVRVLDTLDVRSAVLVGHSMGTQVALEGYRRMQDRVRGVVLLCGSYGRITQTFHGTDVLETVLPRVIERMKRRPALARALWGRIPSRLAFKMARLGGEIDGMAIREEDFLHYWDHVSLMAPDVFLPMLELAGAHTAEDLLESIAVPTLVIAAERDTFTPPDLAEHMAGRIPGARFELIKNGSHAAPVEQPTLIWSWIERWLRDHVEADAAASATGG
jgi:pimeloyl-ACP methyl ester carboxylesterase